VHDSRPFKANKPAISMSRPAQNYQDDFIFSPVNTHKHGLITKDVFKYFNRDIIQKDKLTNLNLKGKVAGAKDEEVENFLRDFKQGDKKVSLLARYSKRASKLVV
jgi:hypothetical protein